jgi:pimeloyl-ACP methyl ester carboxylesterase
MNVTDQDIPSPRQLAAGFLMPDRGKARNSLKRPIGATPLTFPFQRDDKIAAWMWGSGPTILLVHGWEGSNADMDAFVSPLVSAGFLVVALDLPGHGASSGKFAPIPLLADAIRVVGETVGPVYGIVGHSVGCAATVTALSRGLAAERVVLLAAPVSYRDQARMVARQYGFDESEWFEMEASLNQLGADLEAIDFNAMAPTLRPAALFIHSEDDKVIPIGPIRDAAPLWKGALFRTVQGLGHMRLLGDAEVIEDVIAFLKDRRQLV